MSHPFFHRLHRCGEELHEAFATGRHRHGGFGHFAAGFMGAGLGGQGFRTGRKFAAADLQLVLLSLLATRPSHGYELIKALEERSGGFYTPSPGVIYPALTYLEEIGYASVAAEGSKKLYSITDAGREYLDRHRETAQAMLDQLEQIGRRMGRVREVFSGFDDDVGDDESASTESRDVWRARRALKQALREKRHASGDEKTRIAEILRRAADEISRKSGKLVLTTSSGKGLQWPFSSAPAKSPSHRPRRARSETRASKRSSRKSSPPIVAPRTAAPIRATCAIHTPTPTSAFRSIPNRVS